MDPSTPGPTSLFTPLLFESPANLVSLGAGVGTDGTEGFFSGLSSGLGSCFGGADFLFATLAAAELGFMNIGTGSFGFCLGSRLSIGFFGNDCDPDVPFGVEEVEDLSEDGSCLGLVEGLLGWVSSTTLNKSRSNSAVRSSSISFSFLVGDTGAEGVVRAAI